MASLNQVNLIGNLCRDVEMRYTAGGTAVGKMSLAMNRKFKGSDGQLREEVCYVDVTLWGKTAETANNYLSKGSSVFISGYLKLDSWEDKQTGQKRQKLGVVANTMQFVGPKKDGGGQQQSRPAQAQKSRPAQAPQDDLDGPQEVDLELRKEEVPF